MIERLLPYFASLLACTLRFEWRGAPIPERAVVMFWHGTMFAGWRALRLNVPIALVSQSKDGALLASVLRHWGYELVRGSSKKNGMEALENAIEVAQKRPTRLVITPDGPRGPYHEFKRGAFIAAVALDAPLYFVRIEHQASYIFKRSWDRFALPHPFSKVILQVTELDIRDMPTEHEQQKQWLHKLSIRVDTL